MTTEQTQTREDPRPPRQQAESVVVRFAGDSGDGIQLLGERFTQATALKGNDLATLPNYPAEIRAPAGTTFGVSSFQIQFGATRVQTPGDAPDVLVALNPAALKVHLGELRRGGMIVVNTDAFTKRNLAKAGYEVNPVEDATLDGYRLVEVDLTKMTREAVADTGLSKSEADRCKNMFALGLICWLYDRETGSTAEWLRQRFAGKPEVARANEAALLAGHAFGETAELEQDVEGYEIPRAEVEAGTYRTVTGTQALAWGLLAGAAKAKLPITFASYPITPASNLLHNLSRLSDKGVQTFQAEDEIAAVCAAIGASYAGHLGVTSSSGPGIALKGEALGLAVATELPLVVVNAQRAGPSTGMPTKTEQADLFQAMYGRNGDAPLPVLAVATPGDGFMVAIEAIRLATRYMTPVIVLADGYLMNAAEPWAIPDLSAVPEFPVRFRTEAEGFQPFMRDEMTLARSWALPGTPGLEHRIGGLERDAESGHISYDPENHQRMTDLRAAKIERIGHDVPAQAFSAGGPEDEAVIVGWGSTYGAINEAVRRRRQAGRSVAHLHIRYLNPFPANLGELLRGFERVLVPELNNGQLRQILRGEFLIPARGYNQVSGLPLKVDDLENAIENMLEGAPSK